MEIYTVGAYLFAFLLYLLAAFSKTKVFSIAALCSLILGFLGNIYLILRHIIITHRLPLTNTSETLLSAVGLIVLIYLFLEFKNLSVKIIGLFVSLVSSMGLIFGFWILKMPPMPLLPALQSKWLVFHVSSCITAYAFFTIAFIAAMLYLIRGGDSLSSGISRIEHRSISVGFLFLTLGIILGSVWGKSAWGHWWNWDPKETWALITWLIYAGYIHGRLYEKWSERRFAWIAIWGFLACLFTYLGVNYLLKGLHSYA